MRLYPRRLSGIADLKKEKRLLEKRSRELDKEEFLSLGGIFDGKKKKSGEEGGKGSILDYLPVSNPLVELLITIVKRRLNKKGAEKPPKTVNVPKAPTDARPRKHRVKAIAIEFIGGYLKWKAIELSYKAIRRLIKGKKEVAPTGPKY